MRRFIPPMLIATAIVAVLLTVSLLISTSAAEEPSQPKTQHRHSLAISDVPLGQADIRSVVVAEEARVATWLASLPRPEPVVVIVTRAPVFSSTNPGDFLSCVRQRESGGDYTIYNTEGSGAAGAYQFMPGTWNGIATRVGRLDLVGIDPAQASPADQDAMAAALYAEQGSAPWGGFCG